MLYLTVVAIYPIMIMTTAPYEEEKKTLLDSKVQFFKIVKFGSRKAEVLKCTTGQWRKFAPSPFGALP